MATNSFLQIEKRMWLSVLLIAALVTVGSVAAETSDYDRVKWYMLPDTAVSVIERTGIAFSFANETGDRVYFVHAAFAGGMPVYRYPDKQGTHSADLVATSPTNWYSSSRVKQPSVVVGNIAYLSVAVNVNGKGFWGIARFDMDKEVFLSTIVTEKAAWIGNPPSAVHAFTIGKTGYFFFSDHSLWAYDTQANTLTEKRRLTDYKFIPSHSTMATFSVNGKGYIVLQNRSFIEYNPQTDSWTTKPDIELSPPGTVNYQHLFPEGMNVFTLGGKVYIWSSNRYNSALYAYNPKTDSWELCPTPSMKGGYSLAVSVNNNNAIVASGENKMDYYLLYEKPEIEQEKQERLAQQQQRNAPAKAQAAGGSQSIPWTAKPLDLSRYSISDKVKTIYLNDYETDYQFYDGMMSVYNIESHGWGFIDTEGNLIHDYVWHFRTFRKPRFDNGVCAVYKNRVNSFGQNDGKDWYILYKNGRVLKLSDKISWVSNFVDGYAYVSEGSFLLGFNRTYCINTKGEEIYPNVNARRLSTAEGIGEPRPFRDGLAPWYDTYKERWGLFNRAGTIIVPPTYLEVDDFSEGYAAVHFPIDQGRGDKWGYIDTNGRVVIGPTFTKQPGPFKNGYAAVKKTNGMYVYINKSGQVVSPEYNMAYPFLKGYAYVKTADKGFTVVDTNFRVVREFIGVKLRGAGVMNDEYRADVRRKSDAWNEIYNKIEYSDNGEFVYLVTVSYTKDLFTPDGQLYANLGSSDGYFSSHHVDCFYNNMAYCKLANGNVHLKGIVDLNRGLHFTILFKKNEF